MHRQLCLQQSSIQCEQLRKQNELIKQNRKWYPHRDASANKKCCKLNNSTVQTTQIYTCRQFYLKTPKQIQEVKSKESAFCSTLNDALNEIVSSIYCFSFLSLYFIGQVSVQLQRREVTFSNRRTERKQFDINFICILL